LIIAKILKQEFFICFQQVAVSGKCMVHFIATTAPGANETVRWYLIFILEGHVFKRKRPPWGGL
jgi:hypothetical protein